MKLIRFWDRKIFELQQMGFMVKNFVTFLTVGLCRSVHNIFDFLKYIFV